MYIRIPLKSKCTSFIFQMLGSYYLNHTRSKTRRICSFSGLWDFAKFSSERIVFVIENLSFLLSVCLSTHTNICTRNRMAECLVCTKKYIWTQGLKIREEGRKKFTRSGAVGRMEDWKIFFWTWNGWLLRTYCIRRIIHTWLFQQNNHIIIQALCMYVFGRNSNTLCHTYICDIFLMCIYVLYVLPYLTIDVYTAKRTE